MRTWNTKHDNTAPAASGELTAIEIDAAEWPSNTCSTHAMRSSSDLSEDKRFAYCLEM